MANQFLIKNTMNEMRELSESEINSLKGNTPLYDGVQLLGYYEKGDTPNPIIYFLSNTSNEDDGGSVVKLTNGALIHNFGDTVNVKYFGVKSGAGHTTKINKAILYASLNKKKEVVIDKDLDLEIVSTSTRISSGIQIQDDINLIIHGTVRLTPNDNMYSVIIAADNKKNFVIKGSGKIIGDRNKHIVGGGISKYWLQRFPVTPYNLGDYVTIDTFGFKVIQAGISDNSYPSVSSLEIGDTLTDGTAIFEVIRKDKRIRYNNRQYGTGQWLWYKDVAVIVTQGGTSSTTAMTIDDPIIGQQIVDGTVMGEIIHIGNIEGIGEYGIGITLWDSSQFLIDGLSIEECWGDALLVSGATSDVSPNKGCQEFKITNVNISDCRRQGISVLHAKRFIIENITCKNIFGTLPMAGIDLEPEQYNVIEQGQISNVNFFDCFGGGIKMYAFKPGTNVSQLIISNVLAENCGVAIQGDRENVNNIEFNNVSAYNCLNYGVRIHRECTNIKFSGLTVDGSPEGITIGDKNQNIEFNNVQLRNLSTKGINMYSDSENVTFQNIYIDGVSQEAIYNKAVKNLKIINFNIRNSYSGIYMFNGDIRGLQLKVGSIENIQRDAIYLNTCYGACLSNIDVKDAGQLEDNAYYGIRLGAATDDLYIRGIKFTSTTDKKIKYCILSQSLLSTGTIGLNVYDNAFSSEDLSIISPNLKIQKLEPATPELKGIVGQSEPIPFVERVSPNDVSNSSASTLEALVTDYNTLVTSFNILKNLVTENKAILNTKLVHDIISGQQLGNEPRITSLTVSPANGQAPYIIKANFLNKELIDDVAYKLEARRITSVGSCPLSAFPGTVSNSITTSIKNTDQWTDTTTVSTNSCAAVTVRIIKLDTNIVVSEQTVYINNLNGAV